LSNKQSSTTTNTMEGLFFNVNNGYIEGIVRGYRNGLLTGQNYSNLIQCETIDGELRSEGNVMQLINSA
jgi:hypothetical protein